MLTTLVSSNLLDFSEMDKLRGELDGFVTRIQAHPESAKTSWPAIWNEMADRAEFLFQDSRAPTRDRHVRPKILPPRPGKAEPMGKRKNASAAPLRRRDCRFKFPPRRRHLAEARRSVRQRIAQAPTNSSTASASRESGAESLRLKPSIDVGLGPLVWPGRRQDVPQVLAPVQERAANQRMEAADIPERARFVGLGRMAITAESTLGRGQKTAGGRALTSETSACACTRTEIAP